MQSAVAEKSYRKLRLTVFVLKHEGKPAWAQCFSEPAWAQCFSGYCRLHSSPVSIFRTDPTPIKACKGQKHSAQWISCANMKQHISVWDTSLESPCHSWDHSISQISWRLPILFEPCFVFPDPFDMHKYLQRPKNFFDSQFIDLDS
jgi:hypothetical protein